MENIRPAAVAGTFYPSDPKELRQTIEEFLAEAIPISTPTFPKAFILPHAGTIYSGPIAATGYAIIQKARDQIKKVVLLGPAHYVPFEKLALSHWTGFETPLGIVKIDEQGVKKVKELPQVDFSDVSHRYEHSLEVHLPFLQIVLNEFALLPLVVGQATGEDVSRVLETVWGGDDTLIIVSSDLSHHLPYDNAKTVDDETSRKIQALRFKDIDLQSCCGCRPIQGLLHQAKKKGLKGKTLDLRNSGDTAGPKNEVVGYGAFAFL